MCVPLHPAPYFLLLNLNTGKADWIHMLACKADLQKNDTGWDMELNKNMINHRGTEKTKRVFSISKPYKWFGEKLDAS